MKNQKIRKEKVFEEWFKLNSMSNLFISQEESCYQAFLLGRASKYRNKKTEPNPLYVLCVDFWLKVFHIDWTFSAQHGKHLNSIIEKIRWTCIHSSIAPSDELILNSFKKMCLNLPSFYKDKDLAMIDSKYNEIINEIKSGKKKDGFNLRNSQERYSDFAQ